MSKHLPFQIDTLPCVPFSDRAKLPECIAVYFVIDSDKSVLYVGASMNLRARWIQHVKFDLQVEHPSLSIAWFICNENQLFNLEKKAVVSLKPLLNNDRKFLTNIGMNKPMTVGQRVFYYRKQRSLSQQDLATKAKVPISTISMMESGQRDGENMSLSVAKRLAYALDISLHTLAGFDIRKGKRHAAQNGSSHTASNASTDTSAT